MTEPMSDGRLGFDRDMLRTIGGLRREIRRLRESLAKVQTLRKSEVERNIALAAENKRMRAVIEMLEREVDELEEINSRLHDALEEKEWK